MNQVISECIGGLNAAGRVFCDYAAAVSVQSAILVVVLLVADLFLRKRVRAVFRYCVWLLVLAKLILPPTLALPTGIGYWVGDRLPMAHPVSDRLPGGGPEPIVVQTYPPESRLPGNIPADDSSVPAAATHAPTVHSVLARPAITWPAILLIGWLVGVLVFAALLAQRVRFVRGLIAFSSPAEMRFQQIMDECAGRVGIRKGITLRVSGTMSSPAICGLLRPAILVPAKVLETLSPEGLRAVLIHELAHMKRGDLWINSLQTLLQVIHFYNPFVWVANLMIRRTREEAVDETVLVALGGRAKDYSNTLIDIGEMALWKADMGLRLIGVAESQRILRWRIKHMLARPIPKTARIGALGATVIVVMAAVLLPMTRAEISTSTSSAAPQRAEAGATHEASAAGQGDAIVDPNAGLRYVLSKTIAGASDVIEYNQQISLSPNGKFLLWSGQVVPMDGSSAFTLKELKGAGIASWSPDGQKIAFNSEGIEVLPISPETGRPTGPVRRLLDENGDWFRGKIYWSADSKRILFVKWNSRMKREAGSINLGDGHLDVQPDYADFGLLSPDGRTIAYSMPEDGVWARPVGGGAPRIVRAHSSRLFDDPVVWTLDSQWVASAVSGWWREEIHFARVSDGRNFDLFPPEAVGAFVGASADGKKLCFYRSSFEGRMTSKIVSISGGPVLDAGPFPGLKVPVSQSWSSDSASVRVLGIDKEGLPQMWSVPLTGGDRVQFKTESLGRDGAELWSVSPDGGKALYSVDRRTDSSTSGCDLYVVPISLKEGRATGPATLVFEGRQAQDPSLPQMRHAWSPDGTRIAVPHKSDRGNGHWVLFADGSKPIQITLTPDEAESYPEWSPDGKMIALYRCAPDRDVLRVVPAAGGTAKTILTMPKGQFPSFGWSSDSREIAVACDGTISGFPVAGGSARVIVRLQDAGCDGVSWLGWSPDGQHLAFYGEKTGEADRLYLFNPSTSKIATLDNSPKWAGDFTWSPDSKSICCAAEEAQKMRPAGVIRELDVAEAVQKAPAVTETKPAETAATPQAEPIVGPVFADNFDDGPSKHWRFQEWPGEGPPQGHAVENGQLMLAGNARACLDGIDWTDYIVTVRVCVKESVASGYGVFGIVARATPSKFGSGRRDRYNLVIACENNLPNELALTIQYADASDTLRQAGLKSSLYSGLARDTWYTLEFEVRGSRLRGYLDGKLVIDAADARLPRGGVWLNTWRCRALFDDFSVRQLP